MFTLFSLFLCLICIYSYPVIIVPGLGGSVLYNDVGKKIWPPYQIKDLEVPVDKDFRLQLPIVMPEVGKIEDICIDTLPVRLITKSTYYHQLIKRLQEKKRNVYALSYDFRFIHYKEYYEKRFLQYRQFFQDKENTVVICHSLGGLVFHFFLTRMDPNWIRKHISKVIYMNVPFGGTANSFFTMVNRLDEKNEYLGSSQTLLIPFIINKMKQFHFYGGIHMSMPLDTHVPIIRKNGSWYTTSDLSDIMKQNNQAMYNNFMEAESIRSIRNISVNCEQYLFISTGLNTTVFLDIDSKTYLYSDGDGLIPRKSLLYPIHHWTHKPQVFEFKNIEHSQIISNPSVLDNILSLLYPQCVS